MYENLNQCFKLCVVLGKDDPTVIIRAFDDLGWDSAGRVRLTCEVRQGGKVIFPKGQLTCAVHGSSDGPAARELVMSLVAMHPGAGGGEGAEYYEGYSAEQLAWAEKNGEAIDCERQDRYCDENGNVRRSA